ncbi:MAG: hypothetical protein ACPLW8_04335 [Candidatus Bathyarchaeales archaeon]
MKLEKKAEKTVGYVLLVLGLVLIIIPAALAIIMFTNQSKIPQLIETPAGASDFVNGMIVFSNVFAFFFIFIIIVWAGSIVTSRGVTMIKDVKLRLVSKSLKEAVKTAEKVQQN